MLTLGTTGWDRYFVHALNQFGFLFLAIFGLGVIVFTEHYYRTGVEKRRLFSRFFLITFWEVVYLTFMHTAGLISEVVLGLFTSASLLIVVAEGALALALFWLYQRAKQQATKPAL